MKKISIIVPIYKVEKYLKKCIESILDQTFKDFELILVNDGSPDRCSEICNEFSQKDKRIKVIHKENGGVSSARNAGLEIATGEYIAFVDSDDFIHKKMYQVLFEYAEKTSADIVICDYFEVCETETPIEECESIVEMIHNYTNVEALEGLYGEKGVKFVIPWNKLYKRELFSDLEYELGKIHEDEFIAHKLLFKCSKITYLPVKLYFYLQRKESITGESFNLKRLDAIYAYKERSDFFKKIKQKELQHKAELRYLRKIFIDYSNLKKSNIDATREFWEIRKDFAKRFKTLIKNPYYNFKEKLIWIIFISSPTTYDRYIKAKAKERIINDDINRSRTKRFYIK